MARVFADIKGRSDCFLIENFGDEEEPVTGRLICLWMTFMILMSIEPKLVHLSSIAETPPTPLKKRAGHDSMFAKFIFRRKILGRLGWRTWISVGGLAVDVGKG